MKRIKTICIFILSALILSCHLSDEAKLSEKFPENWTQLSRTPNGFVFYEPCDGPTPTIRIKDLYLSNNGQHESQQHRIDKFTRLSDSTYRIICDKSELVINVKWLDRLKSQALWTLKVKNSLSDHSYKMVMCPTELSNNFPFIYNPCPNKKIGEKKFLSVEDY